jgi:hypothetical protein
VGEAGRGGESAREEVGDEGGEKRIAGADSVADRDRPSRLPMPPAVVPEAGSAGAGGHDHVGGLAVGGELAGVRFLGAGRDVFADEPRGLLVVELEHGGAAGERAHESAKSSNGGRRLTSSTRRAGGRRAPSRLASAVRLAALRCASEP